MSTEQNMAPGQPGSAPRWASSAKSGVGSALNVASRVWFTISHGILNEIYYPRLDQACTRDMGLIVTDGQDFFSEEKRHTAHQIASMERGVPAYQLTNTCLQGRYRIEKTVITDPRRDVLLQRVRFVPLQGKLSDYHLYVLLAPHLGNQGSGNTAWVGDYKGVPMLFAQRDGMALALACSTGWLKGSAGFVGTSDGWQDLVRNKRLTWAYERAEEGNVALTGEIDLHASGGECLLALGFGANAAEAGHRALGSLLGGLDAAETAYVDEWRDWQRRLLPLARPDGESPNLYLTSMLVLRTHEADNFPGGIIASLSIPWGNSKCNEDLGGYHLVWPRDLVEAAGGLLAGGAVPEALRVLDYLQVTQEEDGRWPQNMWLDGRPYWNGVQMDETALPILLVDKAWREKLIDTGEIGRYWPMIRRAAGFIVRNGPVTPEDRWEMDPGYSPFTLAAEIAALLAAAEMAESESEPTVAAYLRDTADYWNANVERWVYVAGTDLDRRLGVAGHYVRIAPPDRAEAASPAHGFVPMRTRAPGSPGAAADIVGPDALALVRFGLRTADDPRIVDTVRVIDAVLKVDTTQGPAWRRYVEDQYGEHDDGTAFDGTGVGRAWPLLTGERAHYELAAGRPEAAEKLLRAMEAFAGEGGLLPEQIWDAADIPERELFNGCPSGSAMPLVWAHAEYVKLLRSLSEGRVFDMPPQTVERYHGKQGKTPFTVWRFNNKRVDIAAGQALRLEVLAPAVVHWTADDWRTVHDAETRDTGLGVHVVDLPTTQLPAGATVTFTFFWPGASRWEGADFAVQVITAEQERGSGHPRGPSHHGR